MATSAGGKPKVWQMCLYICIGANSQNFAYTGALVTTVCNFPESRGVVLGLLKGFTGLSGAIMTQIYLDIYGNDSKSLILLIAWQPAAISVVFVYTIRSMTVVKQPNELRIFYRFLCVSIFLALFIMGMTIAQNIVAFSRRAYAGSASVVISVLFVPLFMAIKEELNLWKTNKQQPVSVPEVKIENMNQNYEHQSTNPSSLELDDPKRKGKTSFLPMCS